MSLIDGRVIATAIRGEVAVAVAELKAAGIAPKLATVLPTRDEAAVWYVGSLERAGAEAGIDVNRIELDAPSEQELASALDELSLAPDVHGIICQTPLPEGLTLARLAEHIAAAKDVDGANPVSLGRLAAGVPCFAPATAQAVVEILRRAEVPLPGANAVVVGRSIVVGKPAALLLLAENATVTVCHSKTADLAGETRRADVLVVAAGKAGMIGAGHVKPGAVVVDVGTNPTPEGGIAGDVDTDAVERVAKAITPVPGGVGPVTTAVLLRNVAAAART